MTTTLRPSGPEIRAGDDARARSFAVCVNGRAVGRLELAAVTAYGTVLGQIRALHIDPVARRRGRATVAALAAEEVLRDWRCRRVEVRVPAQEQGALRLAETLGYTESHRVMTKRVTVAPPLSAGSQDRAMTAEAFASWTRGVTERYTALWTERGMAREAAWRRARAEHRRLLPEGIATEGAVLRVLEHEGIPVGTLWLDLRPLGPERTRPWICDVEVAAAHRGRGHGRSLMAVAERECLAAGQRILGLTVRAGNTPAERLYRGLGYHTHTHLLAKPLR